MELNKFEQHIKKELNQREIQPSDNAWDKISKRLDSPKKKKKSSYLWLGIAASFAGLLIISTIYFNYDTTRTDDTNILVKTNKENIETIENESKPLLEKTQEVKVATIEIDKGKTNSKVNENEEVEKPGKVIDQSLKNDTNTIALVQPTLEVNIETNAINKEELLQQKIAEVVAKVDQLEQNEKTLTDVEVDSLILQAQKEILQNKLFRQDHSVDAMALLNEVEGELERPLKDKLFDLLKKGMLETKNALADSN
ncbi:hypothetical protein EGM88_08760 [Aureibaculum marinum]|uniref:Uncharacterized protein n=1 Tax=Aureibaculum marinum TaxID=2487930 RepID=A0A3N4NXZ7_9FLAO|nr:hypothetical protein [Aureibaculum marinum]RPD96449.1 hypothetical protein EGM88_08760 [Aureibaculum marinum]